MHTPRLAHAEYVLSSLLFKGDHGLSRLIEKAALYAISRAGL